jgi:hypothetical protein
VPHMYTRQSAATLRDSLATYLALRGRRALRREEREGAWEDSGGERRGADDVAVDHEPRGLLRLERERAQLRQ